MILQALASLYDRLLTEKDSGIAPPGYSFAPVTHALELDASGNLIAVHPLAEPKGKKMVNPSLLLPERCVRTMGVQPNFLSDNSGYVLGRDSKGKPERTAKTLDAFRELHLRLLTSTEDAAGKALCSFLNRWQPEMMDSPIFDSQRDAILAGGNLVFFFENTYLHDRAALRAIWAHAQAESTATQTGQCLISGEVAPIAQVHPRIKGVLGAQAVGAAIVSFNQSAFEFFGKKQSLSAPISEESAFAYTTALNHMIASLGESRSQCTRIGDITHVHWAETHAPLEEGLLAEMIAPAPTATKNGKANKDESRINRPTIKLMHDVLETLKQGRPLSDLSLDESVRMHLLGLAPNAARLSIRFYYEKDFGPLIRCVAQHHLDMEIVRGPSDPEFIEPWQILRETAAQGESKNIPPALGGSLMRSIYTGKLYSRDLYAAIIMRVRADKSVNRTRAAFVKAYLLRTQKDEISEAITLALNETWREPGYLLGRLFALLEKAQTDALGAGINATIKDRYFGAASSTPVTVFPLLLRLSQHHLPKVKNKYIHKGIQDVLGMMEVNEANPLGFPAKLSMESQGLFMLGYYHQRQAIYTKRETDTPTTDEPEMSNEEAQS